MQTKLEEKLAQLQDKLNQWRSRARRANKKVAQLEAQEKRWGKKLAAAITWEAQAETIVRAPVEVPRQPEPVSVPMLSDIGPTIEKIVDDLSIPAALQRDKKVADEIKAEIEETKKKKAKGRIEKMKAKQVGDLKKMPLTGKAALAYIRGASQ